MTPPVGLIGRWEAAYREYGQAWEFAARTVAGDQEAAEGVSSSSWQVASLWREMAADPGLPWWTLAALRAAAQAFEHQARDWHARATHPRTVDPVARTPPNAAGVGVAPGSGVP